MKKVGSALICLIILCLALTCSASPYCSSTAQGSYNEYISKVKLNSAEKASTGNIYSDYTGSVLTTLTPGHSYVLYVSGWTRSTYTEVIKAWIDYNHDNDFEDSGEEIDLGPHTFSGDSTFSKLFIVPVDAVHGNTRMRVSLKYGANPGPCEDYMFGEVEDYTIALGDQTTTTTSTTTTSSSVSSTSTSTTSTAPPGSSTTSTTAQFTSTTLGTTTTTSSSTTSTMQNYCPATGLSQYEFIREVALNTGNRSSAAGNYSDYTGTPFTQLETGGNYTVYVTVRTDGLGTYQEDVRAWIDYDSDRVYNDPSESIDLGGYNVDLDHTFSASFTVPENAVTGTTRMRIFLRYNQIPEPCDHSTDGEAEDYSVSIHSAGEASTTSTTTSTSTSQPVLSTTSTTPLASATRNLPSTLNPGSNYTVTLSLKYSEPVWGAGLKENFPQDWNVSSITNGGISVNASRIEWIFFNQVALTNTTVSYSIMVPENASGQYTFNGTLLLSSNASDMIPVQVSGTGTVNIGAGCALEGDYPPCGNVTVSEIINLITDWANGNASVSEVLDLITAWATG